MWPSHECLLTNVPALGIVDTTIAGHLSNVPAPGNDDALDSMVFYNTHVAHYILEKKYRNIAAFYRKVFKKNRIIEFNQ
jgi:ribosomal protein S2